MGLVVQDLERRAHVVVLVVILVVIVVLVLVSRFASNIVVLVFDAVVMSAGGPELYKAAFIDLDAEVGLQRIKHRKSREQLDEVLTIELTDDQLAWQQQDRTWTKVPPATEGAGVDTQGVLGSGTPQEVQDDVKRNIEALAPGGGFVFATVHDIQANVPPENIMAMIEAVHEFNLCK